MSHIDREKMIEKLLHDESVDLQVLYELSRIQGGFLNDTLRRRVWPKIVGINRYQLAPLSCNDTSKKEFPSLDCDIARSLWTHNKTSSWEDIYRNQKRIILANTIKSTLIKHSDLHYYQGYHDVVSILLLVFDDDTLLSHMTEKISLSFFQDCMQPNFEILSRSMHIVMILLQLIDPDIYDYLHDANIEPYFSLSWILTWFAHDIKSYDDVTRLYDVLLCSHPLYIFYLSTAVVLHFRLQVLETECDFASLHQTLVTLPTLMTSSAIEYIICKADYWMSIITPTALCSILQVTEYHDLVTTNRLHYLEKPIISRYQRPDWYLLYQSKVKHLSPTLTATMTKLSNMNTIKSITSASVNISSVFTYFKKNRKGYQSKNRNQNNSKNTDIAKTEKYVDTQVIDKEIVHVDNQQQVSKMSSSPLSEKLVKLDRQVFKQLYTNWQRFHHDSSLFPCIFTYTSGLDYSKYVFTTLTSLVFYPITVSTVKQSMETSVDSTCTSSLSRKTRYKKYTVIPKYLWWSLALLGGLTSIVLDTVLFTYYDYNIVNRSYGIIYPFFKSSSSAAAPPDNSRTLEVKTCISTNSKMTGSQHGSSSSLKENCQTTTINSNNTSYVNLNQTLSLTSKTDTSLSDVLPKTTTPNIEDSLDITHIIEDIIHMKIHNDDSIIPVAIPSRERMHTLISHSVDKIKELVTHNHDIYDDVCDTCESMIPNSLFTLYEDNIDIVHVHTQDGGSTITPSVLSAESNQ